MCFLFDFRFCIKFWKMSEPKDRRRRLVPSVNTVKKKPPTPVVKADTPAVLKSPGVIKETRMEANTSKVVQPPGKAQVFVLSPAILKQMGINIGNLQQNPPNKDVDVTKKKKGALAILFSNDLIMLYVSSLFTQLNNFLLLQYNLLLFLLKVVQKKLKEIRQM